MEHWIQKQLMYYTCMVRSIHGMLWVLLSQLTHASRPFIFKVRKTNLHPRRAEISEKDWKGYRKIPIVFPSFFSKTAPIFLPTGTKLQFPIHFQLFICAYRNCSLCQYVRTKRSGFSTAEIGSSKNFGILTCLSS